MVNTINEQVQINDTLDCTSDFSVNTNKFVVDSATGDVAMVGDLITKNITRSLFIPVSAMTKDTTADQDPDDSNLDNAPALIFNDGELNIVRFSFPIPKTWNSGTNIYVEAIWASDVITGNVEWEIDYSSIPTDDTETPASDGTDDYIDAAPTVTNQVISTGENLIISSGLLSADDSVFVKLFRDAQAGNTDDTLVGSALLLGVKIKYTSTR